MKKAKKIAIIFSIILLIGATAFAAVYYFTDIFKTPQEAFYSYMEKATDLGNQTNYQEVLEQLKLAKEKSYKSQTSIGLEINSKDYSNIETQQMLNMLKNVKLNINSNVKPSENKSTSEISLGLGGFNAGKLQLVKDGEIFGVKSELLGNKYLAVENNNLKSLLSKLGIDTSNVPDKFKSIDAYDLLYISKEDQFKLEKTYKDILKDSISEENYTKQENVTQKINGKDVNTTAYTLSLKEKDLINVMLKIIETAEEDETLLNIITEKFNKLLDEGLFDEINVSTKYSLPSKTKTSKAMLTEKISVDTLKQKLKELAKELKEESQYSSTGKAEITVYAANNDVAKVEFKVNNEVLFSADYYNENDKKHIVLYKKQDIIESNLDDYYVPYKRLPKASSELVKILEIEYKRTKGINEKTIDASVIIYEDEEKVGKILIDLTTKGKVGQGTTETSGKIGFEIDEVSFALVIDSKVEYTDDVNVETLDNSNTNILNNMSQKEIEKYFQGIVKDFEDTLSVFGVKSNIFIPKNNLIVEDEKESDIIGTEENVESDTIEPEKNKTIDAEELEKQINELNEQLKKLQESNS